MHIRDPKRSIHRMSKCGKCEKEFACAQNLRKHLARKRPCVKEGNQNQPIICGACKQEFTQATNRNRHIRLGRCTAKAGTTLEALQGQMMELQQRLAEVSKALPPAPQGGAAGSGLSAQVSGAGAQVTQVSGTGAQVTQVSGTLTQVANQVNNNITVNIRPWGAPLALTDGDVEAALATIPGLAGTPTLAEVVSALIKLVQFEELRRTHRRKRGTST